MLSSTKVKIVVFAPETDADKIREAMGKAGVGKIGNYTFVSFSSKGIGRWKTEKGAHPYIGKVGEFEAVAEERIEVECEMDKVGAVVEAIKKVHPYEEPVIDVYSLEEI